MTQLQAMLLSFALEVPVAVLVARLVHASSPRALALVALAAVLGTCVTHPLVWHLNVTLVELAGWPRLIVLELGAFVVEGLVYLFVGRMKPSRAFLTSFLANGFSFGVGLVIFRLLD